jgi:glycosyltransferase involved in cell wall biosynthesis
MSTSYPNQAEVSTDRDSGNHPLPKISIVTINYNRLADLKKTFNNVISLKNFHEYEYIIVDGGSSDGSVDFLTENSELISQWVSEPDRGIYDAMNKGATLASGEWIIFMNAGDCFFAEDTLQEVEAYLKSSVDVIIGGVESIYNDRYGYRTIKSEPHDLEQFWHQIPTCHQSILVKRDLQVRYPFDPNLSWCADHDFLAKLYSLNHQFEAVPIVISKFEASGDRKRDLLSYTKERWNIYRQYFDRSLSRELYFINEYRSFWIQQNINGRIRDFLPTEWTIYLRKLRGIY